MSLSLVVSSTYQDVQIALAEDGIVQALDSISKRDASKLLVPRINALLNIQRLSLARIDYLTVNRGPSPFTTLRTTLTTVNGIAFARTIPIAGIDGLRAFVMAHMHIKPPLLALLNAYNNDAYYALQLPEQPPEIGCKRIEQLFAHVYNTAEEPITVIGNGVSFFKTHLDNADLKKLFTIPKAVPQYVTIGTIAAHGFKHFSDGLLEQEVMPLYLK